MFNLTDKHIRICLNERCGVIYIDANPNLDYIKPCKKCGKGSGFFETLNQLYGYIDWYGIDSDLIIDKGLLAEICKKYKI